MRLMTEVVRGTSLGVLMKQARLGDQIVVHEGVFRTFRSHLDGAVIGRDDGLYLNGVQKLISGSFFDYQVNLDVVYTRIGNKILREGKVLVYEGEIEDWRATADGVFVKAGKRFYKNQELICEVEYHDWKWHPKGVLTRLGNTFRLNGGLVYEGVWDYWFPHSRGVLIVIGNRFRLNGLEDFFDGPWDEAFVWDDLKHESLLIVRGNKLFQHGTKLIYEGYDLCHLSESSLHHFGMMLASKDQLILKPFVG